MSTQPDMVPEHFVGSKGYMSDIDRGSHILYDLYICNTYFYYPPGFGLGFVGNEIPKDRKETHLLDTVDTRSCSCKISNIVP